MTRLYLICGVELLLLLLGSAYEIPENNCSKYFTYGFKNGNYFGLFTAPRAGYQSIVWTVTFGWQFLKETPIASVTHYPSREEAIQNINNGLPAQLIVRFRNFGVKLPQLIDLQFNNEPLCSNTGDGNTATITSVIYATKPIRAVYNARPELTPVFPTIASKRSLYQWFDH